MNNPLVPFHCQRLLCIFPGGGGRKRKATDSPASKKEPPQKQRPIVHPRFKPGGSGTDHTVRMMVQPSTPMEIDLIKKQDEKESVKNKSSAAATPGSPGGASMGGGGSQYNCSICGFSATRLNVIILHNKTHRCARSRFALK